MRKWLITGICAVVVVILAGFFLITPYYTGRTVEQFLKNPSNYQEFLTKGQKLESIKVQRGWFSSKATAVVDIRPVGAWGSVLMGQSLLNPAKNIRVVVTADIDHGPLLMGKNVNGSRYFTIGKAYFNIKETFTSESLIVLKRAGINSQAMVASSAIEMNYGSSAEGSSMVYPLEFINHLTFGNAALDKFSLDWKIGFSDKAISYAGETSAIKVTSEGNTVALEPLSFDVKWGLPMASGRITGTLDLEGAVIKNKQGTLLKVGEVKVASTDKQQSFSLEDLNATLDEQELAIPSINFSRVYSDKERIAGNTTLSIPSLQYRIGKNTQVEISKLSMSGDQTVANQLLQGTTKLSVDSVKYNDHEFGPLSLSMNMNKWFVPALLSYNHLLKQTFLTMSTMSDTSQQGFSRRQQLALAENKIKLIRLQYQAMQMWPKVVNQGAQIKVDPLTIAFPSGNLKFNFSWLYPNQPNVTNTGELMAASDINAKVEASQSLVHDALVFLLRHQTGGKVDQKALENRVKAELKTATEKKDLIAQGDNYLLTFRYHGGNVYVNGHMLNSPITNSQTMSVGQTSQSTSSPVTTATNNGNDPVSQVVPASDQTDASSQSDSTTQTQANSTGADHSKKSDNNKSVDKNKADKASQKPHQDSGMVKDATMSTDDPGVPQAQ